MLFELFKAHRCHLLALGWLRHRPAPFRVPSNRPAATTDIAIAPSATAHSRTIIRWSLFIIAPFGTKLACASLSRSQRHRDGKGFVVRADEKLAAFLEPTRLLNESAQ
jgi:hypothetical protein